MLEHAWNRGTREAKSREERRKIVLEAPQPQMAELKPVGGNLREKSCDSLATSLSDWFNVQQSTRWDPGL